jgi:hypothetical protein
MMSQKEVEELLIDFTDKVSIPDWWSKRTRR